MQSNEQPLHYVAAPEQLPEEQPDARLVPFTPLQAREEQPPAPAPDAFPVSFNAFQWREFSEWQRLTYGNGSNGASSNRDQALQGKGKATEGRKFSGRYGSPPTPQEVAAAKTSRGYVAPLRMTTKTFSLGQAAVAAPVAEGEVEGNRL